MYLKNGTEFCGTYFQDNGVGMFFMLKIIICTIM